MTATLVAQEFGPEFAELRAARKDRVLAAMERAGIDALVLGRSGNGKYVAGHRGLWRAVLGSFGPMVLLVRSTGGIHLAASTWDDGIPAEIPRENLTGLTWNPRDAISGLVRAEGLADCKRIGADGMSQGIAGLLEMLAPGVELVDGEALMRQVRRVKLPAEIDVIRTGIAIAEGAVATAVRALTPRVTERDIQGVFMDAMASAYAVTVPALAGTFRIVDGRPPQQGAGDRVVRSGDRFAINAGVLYTGYEADVSVSVDVDGVGRLPRNSEVLADVIKSCRAGVAPSDLLASWTGPVQPGPLVTGLGMGIEPPIVGGPGGLEQFDDEPLEAGMVLGLQAWTGDALHGAVVHVTDSDPFVLTRLG